MGGGVFFLTTKPAHCEAKRGWWTLGSRTGMRLSLNFGGDRYAHWGTSARFGHGSDRAGTQFSNLTH